MKRSSLLIVIFLVLTVICLLLAVPYVKKLDEQITSRFEGRRWELPARIYARPLELYIGKSLSVSALEKELKQLRYSRRDLPDKPGEYSIKNNTVTIYSRAFPFPDGLQPATHIEFAIQGKIITSLRDPDTKEMVGMFRLEPLQYASIYPTHNEDRLLIKLEDAPGLLIETLLLIEMTFSTPTGESDRRHRQSRSGQPQGRKNHSGRQHPDPAAGKKYLSHQ